MQMSRMDFDLSKENIQPLRGGRNATQLGIALQAQTNQEYQRELLQQKEVFENAIRTYDGEDPLENWYNYISWAEQSYPKHGHEGNEKVLLENCLGKFEHDKRYMNDRRFCKLWIKFIDYHQNPLDLYHMLYSKGIGRGCADIYRAWAYYHEVSGDFKNADLIFERGKKELAQPLDELIAAHDNMVFAFGQQLLKGVNRQRLEEQRLALTSLKSYKHGKVSSVRIPSSSGAGTLGTKPPAKSNAGVPVVYEDMGENITGAEAAPLSVIAVAKKDEISKENILKPGPWTTVQNKFPVTHRVPAFTVHEDSNDIHQRGLILPSKFCVTTHEDYSTFKPSLLYAEPHDPLHIPKYPKHLVYEEEHTEYSIEEIKARQYLVRPCNSLHDPHLETEQAIQSILGYRSAIDAQIQHISPYKYQQVEDYTQPYQPPHFRVDYPTSDDIENNYNPHASMVYNQQVEGSREEHAHFGMPGREENLWAECSSSKQQFPQQQQEAPLTLLSPVHQPISSPPVQQRSQDNYASPFTVDALWRSPNESHNESRYRDSGIMHVHAKGSAMKTPFKILSDDDLAETGSRGGLDIAAAAQPVDGAIITLDEDTNSSYGECAFQPEQANFDATSTQAFNFNLTAMKVSTPCQKKANRSIMPEEVESSKKQLFQEEKALSTIFEETKSYGTSSSGSSVGTHSKRINQINLTPEQNSYSSNLAQNLKANAALRSSLLGEYMDCQSQESSPVTEMPPPIPAVKPTAIVPLSKAPSDPFHTSLIKMLLERINFPGQHTYGYCKMHTVPRLNIKKEIVVIGDNRYVVEKMLGKGTYGSVFKAIDWHTREAVALKFQKPPNKWEFYICRELLARLANHPLKEKFMDVSIGYFNDQASILVSDFSPNGSLLDVANAIKQKSGRTMKEMLCVYFCIEMLEIIGAMHQAKIIHADVKPDNFLVQLVDDTVTLQLIDFGCSIDMAMFPPDTTFNRRVRTEDFVCCEMYDGRPWSYHTDLFCVAATAHVLLFDKYIQMQKKDGHWSITQRFSRYWRVDCWNMFFSSLLNQQTGPAKIEPLVTMLKSVLEMNINDYYTELRFLVNLLKGR